MNRFTSELNNKMKENESLSQKLKTANANYDRLAESVRDWINEFDKDKVLP